MHTPTDVPTGKDPIALLGPRIAEPSVCMSAYAIALTIIRGTVIENREHAVTADILRTADLAV